ncbi:MAG: carboxypeptidase-like regulatory domain-containing protein [Acidobacteria bacterium]|nr:carboxypeptidase-like regulatory domain-containing protein [Acidobacteriota bacterium]
MKVTGLLNTAQKTTLSVLAVLMVVPTLMLAQSTFGTLTGTVTDPSGAVIAGARVVITNKRTQASRILLSGTGGNYLAPNLDAGVYELTFEAAGFQRLNWKDVELLARQTVRADGRLELNVVLDRANGASGKYHVFTTEVTKRFSRGLSFQNSYVWAKNLSNANGVAPSGFSAENGPTMLDYFDIAQDYGDVTFTRRDHPNLDIPANLNIGSGRLGRKYSYSVSRPHGSANHPRCR